SILESDGYDCSTTPCTKDGQKLSIEYSTVSDNTRRTTTEELLQNKVGAAGFAFQIKNYEAGVLFNDVGPKGTFTIADYASGGSAEPSVTATCSCDAIPTRQNGFAGGNWDRWCDSQADALMKSSDQELDAQKRLQDFSQLYALEAKDLISLPL